MTEAEWMAANDPLKMLESLKGVASDRKLRLFAVACCRVDGLDRSSRRAANELTRTEEAAERNEAVSIYLTNAIPNAVFVTVALDAFGAARRMCDVDANNNSAQKLNLLYRMFRKPFQPVAFDLASRCTLLRCAIGNPFRPVAVDPSWLTSTVVALAQHIYHERAIDQMPILADALQDAGCDNDDILRHCRELGEHVGGCWVVDLVLGKK